jgi:hypothetical protein
MQDNQDKETSTDEVQKEQENTKKKYQQYQVFLYLPPIYLVAVDLFPGYNGFCIYKYRTGTTVIHMRSSEPCINSCAK